MENVAAQCRCPLPLISRREMASRNQNLRLLLSRDLLHQMPFSMLILAVLIYGCRVEFPWGNILWLSAFSLCNVHVNVLYATPVNFRCIPSKTTAIIKLELLPLTDGIITLDTLQIDVEEKGVYPPTPFVHLFLSDSLKEWRMEHPLGVSKSITVVHAILFAPSTVCWVISVYLSETEDIIWSVWQLNIRKRW